jgi:tetratricopeptide (TPR) repeat protein
MTEQDQRSELARVERYLQQDPSNTSLLARAFDLSMAMTDLDLAGRYLDRALAVAPDDPFFRFGQAELLSAQGRWADAEPLYAALLREHANAGVAHGLARCQARGGAHTHAVATLWPFRDAADFPAAAATQLVRSLHHAGRGDEALEYARDNEARYGTVAAFCAAASLAALDEGDMDMAARLSAVARSAKDVPAEALVVDGTIALAGLHLDVAVDAYQQALAAHPGEARSLAGMGSIHLIQRDFAGALAALEQAHRGMPEHIGTLHLLGWCKLFMGDTQGAVQDFNAALELDRNFADSHGAVAVVHAMRGERAQAEREAEVARRLDPASLSARYAQMVLDGDTADPERFARLADRVLEGYAATGGISMAALLRNYRGR